MALEKTQINLVFCSLIRTFAGVMKISDRLLTALLGVLVAVLVALCVQSVQREMKSEAKQQQSEHGRTP